MVPKLLAGPTLQLAKSLLHRQQILLIPNHLPGCFAGNENQPAKRHGRFMKACNELSLNQLPWKGRPKPIVYEPAAAKRPGGKGGLD